MGTVPNTGLMAKIEAFEKYVAQYEHLAEISHVEPVKKGYGEGSFVVVRGVK